MITRVYFAHTCAHAILYLYTYIDVGMIEIAPPAAQHTEVENFVFI